MRHDWRRRGGLPSPVTSTRGVKERSSTATPPWRRCNSILLRFPVQQKRKSPIPAASAVSKRAQIWPRLDTDVKSRLGGPIEAGRVQRMGSLALGCCSDAFYLGNNIRSPQLVCQAPVYLQGIRTPLMRHRFASRGCLPTKAFYRTSPYLLPIRIVSPGCGWEQITDFGSMGCRL